MKLPEVGWTLIVSGEDYPDWNGTYRIIETDYSNKKYKYIMVNHPVYGKGAFNYSEASLKWYPPTKLDRILD